MKALCELQVVAIKRTAKENMALYGMYLLCLPAAIALRRLKVSPNQITLLSLLLAAMSFSFLLHEKRILFVVAWLCSILLDLCDGMVARLSKKISQHKIDVDQLADLLKIISLIAVSQLVWESTTVAVLSCVFLGTIILHRVVSSAVEATVESTASDRSVDQGHGLWRPASGRQLRSFILVPAGTFDAHSLMLFVVIPYSERAYSTVLGYVGLVLAIQTFRSVRKSKHVTESRNRVNIGVVD